MLPLGLAETSSVDRRSASGWQRPCVLHTREPLTPYSPRMPPAAAVIVPTRRLLLTIACTPERRHILASDRCLRTKGPCQGPTRLLTTYLSVNSILNRETLASGNGSNLYMETRRRSLLLDRSSEVVSWIAHIRRTYTSTKCISKWQENPEVLAFDNTYKTNKFSMPLLQTTGITSVSTTFRLAFALSLYITLNPKSIMYIVTLSPGWM